MAKPSKKPADKNQPSNNNYTNCTNSVASDSSNSTKGKKNKGK